jgi:hypothetical protein
MLVAKMSARPWTPFTPEAHPLSSALRLDFDYLSSGLATWSQALQAATVHRSYESVKSKRSSVYRDVVELQHRSLANVDGIYNGGKVQDCRTLTCVPQHCKKNGQWITLSLLVDYAFLSLVSVMLRSACQLH